MHCCALFAAQRCMQVCADSKPQHFTWHTLLAASKATAAPHTAAHGMQASKVVDVQVMVVGMVVANCGAVA
jgi:hypothetical protein